jgi:DNA-binding response OmpR family regulator
MVAQPGRLVLVVDDDAGIRELLSLLITKDGWRVETAEDGAEAERKASALNPDLIVLDMMLPRYGGFELLKHLQGSAQSRVPIVVVTGRYMDATTAEMIRQESNVVEFMEKPVDSARFLRVLNRILRPSWTDGKAAEA